MTIYQNYKIQTVEPRLRSFLQIYFTCKKEVEKNLFLNTVQKTVLWTRIPSDPEPGKINEQINKNCMSNFRPVNSDLFTLGLQCEIENGRYRLQ